METDGMEEWLSRHEKNFRQDAYLQNNTFQYKNITIIQNNETFHNRIKPRIIYPQKTPPPSDKENQKDVTLQYHKTKGNNKSFSQYKKTDIT